MPETLTPELGEKLKLARERRDLTQDEVARRCKVDPKTYRGWEKGRGLPSEVMLRGLASLFEVPAEALIDPSDYMPRYVHIPCNQLSFELEPVGAGTNGGQAWMPTFSQATNATSAPGGSRKPRSTATDISTEPSRETSQQAA